MEDYTPVIVPNGVTAESKIVDGVRVFHLTAEPITQEIAPGLTVDTWGYNGTVPGPVLELCEGEKVRIYVTNNLPAKTSVHWHGVLLPCGMDGVSGLTQPAIKPGETFLYEFYFPDAGTFMYHPHFDSMTQEGMGLTGMIVVHERLPKEERPDRDFSIMLHEWKVAVDTRRPNTNEMTDFNVLTMNGKAMPGTEPLVAKLGGKFQFGATVLGGMANMLRVREGNETYEDPGPYKFPKGSVSLEATAKELERDGIIVKPFPQPKKSTMHERGMDHGEMKKMKGNNDHMQHENEK